jgi:hypothetical protein
MIKLLKDVGLFMLIKWWPLSVPEEQDEDNQPAVLIYLYNILAYKVNQKHLGYIVS